MKKYLLIICFTIIGIFYTYHNNLVSASIIFGGKEQKMPYNNDKLGLDEGVKQVKDSGILGIITTGTASDYIQRVVIYLLGFLALIAVILIIYAGFNLLISVGDEEKAKKSKTIILYSLLGLIVIFLAWPITSFVIGFLT